MVMPGMLRESSAVSPITTPSTAPAIDHRLTWSAASSSSVVKRKLRSKNDLRHVRRQHVSPEIHQARLKIATLRRTHPSAQIADSALAPVRPPGADLCAT